MLTYLASFRTSNQIKLQCITNTSTVTDLLDSMAKFFKLQKEIAKFTESRQPSSKSIDTDPVC